MLVFGHAGLTLGIAAALAGLTNNSHFTKDGEVGKIAHYAQSSRVSAESPNYSKTHKALWIESLADYADLRLLLIGSLLPDIIDKPVGEFFFRQTFSNGRIFGHTLLFLALITIVGLYLYRRRRKTWLLALSFGTFTHLIFDQMWRDSHTLLWPAYGFPFTRVEIINWLLLFKNPQAYIPELVGAAILAWFAQLLVRRRRVFAFFRYGKV